MRKAMPVLGAALSVLAMTWANQAQAQDKKFQDVPESHWAYQAVTELQNRNILQGYPDGYFRGKRTLTRYEFAVALQRALANLPAGTQGAKGDPGPQGEPGPVGPPGLTPEEVTALRNLTQEFQNELRQLGTDVRALSARLDALAQRVGNLERIVSRFPQISGDFFVGGRFDRSRYGYVDYSGAARPANEGTVSNGDAVHDLQLNIRQNLPNGVVVDVTPVISNYLGYRTSGFGQGAAGLSLGGPSAANRLGYTEEVNLYEARVDIPIGNPTAGTTLTLGRYRNQVTPLTYYRPDTDAYFDVPGYDDGNYVQDGFKIQTRIGSATTSVWAGSFSTLGSTNGTFFNKPLVGASVPYRSVSTTKPFGLDLTNQQGAVTASQVAGIHIGVPIGRIAEIGATLIDLSSESQGPVPASPYAGIPAFNGGNVPFTNVVVYGANAKFLNLGRFSLQAEAAKSTTMARYDASDGSDNEDNNGYLLNAGYNSGPITATLGYQYFDPRFVAPGYWNKIGNWYNPTNVKGPFARVGYRFTNALSGYLGADYLEGARNRAIGLGGGVNSGFGVGDNLTRAIAGIKFIVNKTITLGGDYEGVFYDISGAASASGTRSKPVEQYITASAGLNLTSNTVLKLAYQIINFQNVGGGFVGGFGGAGFGGSNSNASVFTAQAAVHF